MTYSHWIILSPSFFPDAHIFDIFSSSDSFTAFHLPRSHVSSFSNLFSRISSHFPNLFLCSHILIPTCQMSLSLNLKACNNLENKFFFNFCFENFPVFWLSIEFLFFPCPLRSIFSFCLSSSKHSGCKISNEVAINTNQFVLFWTLQP